MIGWVDASAGASGDMLLGALLDAGVPLEVVQRAVDAVSPEPVRLSVESVVRCGVTATRCHVDVADSHHHRTWLTIRRLLVEADLPDDVRRPALDAFERLAVAEAAVHGTTPDEVHFHEVGALDAIADVVGVCAGFAHLGLDAVVVSTIAVGSGTIRGAAHGDLPVPPPAVVGLLTGAPTTAGPGTGESCTPTGAALLRTWASSFGGQPPMVVSTSGSGAGGRDPHTHPNVTRLLVGEPLDAPTEPGMLVLEANVDDLDPRVWPDVLAALLDAGAADAWLTPIVMKKGRPAHTVSALVDHAVADDVRTAMLTHTSTIGIRETRVQRTVADRELVTVEVLGHAVAVKVARHGGRVVSVQPEWDDVARAATALGLPAKRVLAEATAAAAHLWR